MTPDTPIKPVAIRVNGRLRFTYQLMSKTIPPNAPQGEYEVVVVFFELGMPIAADGKHVCLQNISDSIVVILRDGLVRQARPPYD